MKKETSWESVADWYDKAVGPKGHYHHVQTILPGALRLLALSDEEKPSVLDLCCGQGVLHRSLPQNTPYLGIDASKTLLQAARKGAAKSATFLQADLSEPLDLKDLSFTHACILLALQNIERPQAVLQTASAHLKKGGKLLIVLNHPCFRIPRQSSWGIDESKKVQYRRVDCYMTPLHIPIQMHPGEDPEKKTLSFHRPLSYYVHALSKAGFVVRQIEEWCSERVSQGAKSRMENRARKEIPLFLALLSTKEF